MPSYNPFLILAFAGAYLAARLITVRSGRTLWLAAGLVAGLLVGLAAAWILDLAVTLAARPSAIAATPPTFETPRFPSETLLWVAALGSALGASFGDWIRRQRAAGMSSMFHGMAPVALTAILVLFPVVFVAAVVIGNRPTDEPVPAAPSPAVAVDANHALI